MYYSLNDEQKMLAQTVRRFVEKECPKAKVRQIMQTEDAYDAELWQQMATQGWLGLTIPEEYGGLGESWLTVAALFEELGRGLVPGPLLATVGLTVSALVMAGTDHQKARWLPNIADGVVKGSLAYLEPANSLQPDAITTVATPTGNGQYTLHGTKMFALDANIADILIVTARLGGPNGEIGLFLVEKGASGLKVENLAGMDLTRRLARVNLENTLAEKLDAAVDSRQALDYILQCGCLVLCAENIGGIRWILDTSVAYAKNREQYGRLIGSYQAIAHPLVDRTLELTSGVSALYDAAYALDNQTAQVAEAISMAKAHISDSYREAGYTGVQTHGGIGFTWEHDMQLYFRRGSATWSLLGDPAWHRERMLQLLEL